MRFKQSNDSSQTSKIAGQWRNVVLATEHCISQMTKTKTHLSRAMF